MEVLILFYSYIFAHVICVILIIVLICLNNTRADCCLLIVIFKVTVRILIIICAL